METRVCFVYETHRFTSKLRIPCMNQLNTSVKLARSSKLGCLREFGFRTSPRVFASCNSLSKGLSYRSPSCTVHRQVEEDSSGSASPLYVPTPPNRELRTPHSGYVIMIYWVYIYSRVFMFAMVRSSTLNLTFTNYSSSFIDEFQNKYIKL